MNTTQTRKQASKQANMGRGCKI